MKSSLPEIFIVILALPFLEFHRVTCPLSMYLPKRHLYSSLLLLWVPGISILINLIFSCSLKPDSRIYTVFIPYLYCIYTIFCHIRYNPSFSVFVLMHHLMKWRPVAFFSFSIKYLEGFPFYLFCFQLFLKSCQHEDFFSIFRPTTWVLLTVLSSVLICFQSSFIYFFFLAFFLYIISF